MLWHRSIPTKRDESGASTSEASKRDHYARPEQEFFDERSI